jgi:outer membrane protein assembly factor BamB
MLSGVVGLAMAGLAAGPAAAVDSPTYGYGNARLGTSPGPVGLSTKKVKGLHTAWRATLSGAIDGQPLVVNGVRIRGRIRNLVLVATEHGAVVALEVGSGRIVWERHVASKGISPSCQASPDGSFGVTATMVADKPTNRVYAVDVIGRAWAFDLRSGRTIKGWPVFIHKPGNDFDWGALGLSRGWLYVPVASLCDKGRYYGGIHAVNVAHPSQRRHWLTTGFTNAYAGGIWGWGGESIDSRTGNVFVATGNALPLSMEAAGSADRVVQLSPTLRLLKRNYPLNPPFQIDDRDFGTAPVLIQVRGCPLQAIAIDKDGWMYRYAADHIDQGPRQSIQVADITSSTIPLYGMPVFDPVARRLVLTSPASGPNGRRKGIQSYRLTRRCTLVPGWQHGFDSPSAGSAPTIAEGVLYLGTGRNGILRAYRLGNGQELASRSLGSTIFAAPVVADGTVFAADWGGDLWAFRGS